MSSQVESMLNRADELLRELEDEYDGCLKTHNITERAQNITHEVLEKLRNALDHTMRRAWEKYIEPSLSEQDRKRAVVYLPIVSDLHGFRSILGRGFMSDLDKVHKNLYDFLLSKQPFSSKENQWLKILAEIVGKSKHVQLIPQRRTEEARRIKVTGIGGGGGSVSWDPSSVKFGRGVSVVGAPIDPSTQRVVPTPGVTEQVEIWVSFILEDYGVNALGFCKEVSQKTRALIKELCSFL